MFRKGRGEGLRKKISDSILNVIVEEADHWKECQRKSQQNFFLLVSSAALNPIRSSTRVTSRGRHAAAARFLVVLDSFEGRDDAEVAWLEKVLASSVSFSKTFWGEQMIFFP